MRLNTKRIAADEAELEMTPMIDVTFLLLIFFMCTIKFKSLEGKLAAYLPKGQGLSTQLPEPSSPITLKIVVQTPGQRLNAKDPSRSWTGKGDFTLAGHTVAYRVNRTDYEDSPAGHAALEGRLSDLHRADATRKIELSIGEGVVHEDVIGVLDLCAQVGFSDVTFQAR